MRFLYFHGGPGFNSNPEESLLDNHGLDFIYWNEPSRKRNTLSTIKNNSLDYEEYNHHLDKFFVDQSNGKKVNLIGHSFGCHNVVHLARTYPDFINKIFLISPDLDLEQCDRNMLKAGLLELDKNEDKSSFYEVLKFSKVFDGTFSDELLVAFSKILECPEFFSHYWDNKERMVEFLSHYNAPLYDFDLENFVSIRKSYKNEFNFKSNLPVTVIYGLEDQIITIENELNIINSIFSSVESIGIENSAHYPHIESHDEVFKIMLKLSTL